MAKRRIVNTRFWKDLYVRSLSTKLKILFLYLLTNPSTEISGVYEIAPDEIAADVGYAESEVLLGLEKFEKDGRIVYRNGWLVIRNFRKHQALNPSVQRGIEIALATAPEWVHSVLDGTAPAPMAVEEEEVEEPQPDTVRDDIRKAFEHWQRVHKKSASQLDPKRETRIRAMLKKFTAEQLCQAIDGALKDDWLMGKDAKSTKAYNGIETILRDAAQIERLIELGAKAKVNTVKMNIPAADWAMPEMKRGSSIPIPEKYQKTATGEHLRL